MKKTKMLCHNFSGINRNVSVFGSSLITATDMQNVELFSTESNSGVGIRTMNGNVSICELIPEDEIVINIFESVQKSNVYFFVHTENEEQGKIYLFSPDSNTLTLKKSGLSVTGKSCARDVQQGWSDLFVFSNSEELLTIELDKYNEHGQLDEVILFEPTDVENRPIKGMGLALFDGRLWIFNGQTLWYSVQENIYDFSTNNPEIVTSAGFIEFVKNITAIYPYIGMLAVFHRDSSCLVGIDENQGFYKSLDSPGGCSGCNALVFHGTILYFYDDTKKGIFSFQQVVNGDRTLGENIALNIQDELFRISISGASGIKAISVVTESRNEIWFLLPYEDKNYSTIMIYDCLRNCWIKRKSQKINSLAIINGKLYSAGRKIYEELVSSDFDGEFIESYYKASSLNLGEENSFKIFSIPPKITMDMKYNNDFYVDYMRDCDFTKLKTRRIVSKTLKNYLYFDFGYWDLSIYPHEKINVIKRLPAAYFKTLQMTFYTKEIGQNFCINSLEFGKIKVKG